MQLGITGEIIRIKEGGKNLKLTKEVKKGFKTYIKGGKKTFWRDGRAIN